MESISAEHRARRARLLHLHHLHHQRVGEILSAAWSAMKRRLAGIAVAALWGPWALWALCALAGCGGGGGDEGGTPVAFSTVEMSAFSGIDSATTAVVRDDATWAALWARHAANRSPAPAAPSVNFAREEVLALFLGSRASGCSGLEIRRVIDEGGRRTVVYAETAPLPNVACAAVISTPALMVRAPASLLPVVFRAE